MDIYVGNLPYDASEADVEAAFAEFGSVARVKIIVDHDTGRSKGFAFVSMEEAEGAQRAIEEMDGADFSGRPLRVNEARPREPKPRFQGGGGGGYKKGGGGGGRRDHGGGGRDWGDDGPSGGGGGYGKKGGGGHKKGGPRRDRKRDFGYGDEPDF
ncbi:MAG: RNA-binding protein [Verrucomicrobiota bacterium]